MNGSDYSMDVSQKYQEVTVEISDGTNSFEVKKAKLQGRRLTVQATNGSKNYIFSGRVEGGKILGMMQTHNGEEKTFANWSASK